MKNMIKVALVAVGIFSFGQSHAQTDRDSTLGHKIGKTAKVVGHATAHAATITESAIVDKKYDGKRGPNGETIYINRKSRYYYVSKRGHHVYLKKSQLMNEPKED